MADTYEVLKGKYQMALVSLREVRQEKAEISAKMDELRKNSAQMEKNVKYLCETILKKDRETKDETSWFKLELPQMVAEAQASLERYFPSMEKLYRRLLELNSERTDRIAELQKEKEQMEAAYKKELVEQAAFKDEKIAELAEKLKTGRIDDEEVKKIVASSKGLKEKVEDIDMAPGDDGSITIYEEDGDDLSAAVAESVTPFVESGEAIVPAKGAPPVQNTEKTRKAVKDAADTASEEKGGKVAEIAKLLTDQQRLTIRIMGDTGHSAMPDIIAAGEEKFPEDPVKSRVTTGMQSLIKRDKWKNGPWPGYIVQAVPCPLPGRTNYVLYELTDMGRDLYRYLFGKDAKESEMSAIIRNHTSAEHGYGIKDTAEMMRDSTYIKKMGADVIYMTRTKEFTVKVGENNSYIPDIVVRYKGKNGTEYKEYFEYETGKCQGKDFTAKCNKMVTFTRWLNFIVKDKDTKELILKELTGWKAELQEAGYPFKWDRPVEGRVLTYAELKNQSNVGDIRQIDWTKISISKPRRKEERK